MHNLLASKKKLPKNFIQIVIAYLILIIVAFIAYQSLNTIKNYNKNNISKGLNTVLQTTQESLLIWVKHRKVVILELATNPQVVSLTEQLLSLTSTINIKEKNEVIEELQNILMPSLLRYEDDNFFIIAPSRKVLASIFHHQLNKDFPIKGDSEKYISKSFTGNKTFIPPLLIPSSDKNSFEKQAAIFFTAPIKSASGEVIAVIAIQVDPFKRFSEIIRLGRLGDTGETYAFNDQAMLVSESRFDSQLEKINLIPVNGKSLLSVKLFDPGVNLLTTPSLNHLSQNNLTLMVESALNGINGENTNGYNDYRGVPVFGAWVWNDNLDIGLTTEIDETEALEPYTHFKQTLIYVLIVTLSLSFGFTFYIMRMHKRSNQSLQHEKHKFEQQLIESTQELNIAKFNLELLNTELVGLVITDSLTTLSNRRHFDEHLASELQRCYRGEKPISILFMDIDHFKLFNDHYGHLHGDECLKKVSRILIELNIVQRPGDLLARYGGEEFVIVLSDTAEEYAVRCAKKIISAMHQHQIEHIASKIPNIEHVTLSIGIATQTPVIDTVGKELLDQADSALYQAKALGRNQFYQYSSNRKKSG